MKKVIYVMALMACLLVIAWSSGCLDDDDGDQGTKGNVVTMSLGELMDDFNRTDNNETRMIKEWFESIDEGDILIIHDKIINMTYNATLDYTGLEFESYGEGIFSIAGDITDRFRKGDTVNVTLHTILTNFTQQDDFGETWTIELEIFDEMWNEQNNTYQLTPPENIELVTSEGTTITMTYEEFITDFNESYNNDTKRYTAGFVSLDEGDTVIIRDTIQNITYWENYNHTSLQFVSSQGNPYHIIQIQGNITGEYTIGDTVEIELTIKTFVFTEKPGDETWTFEIETFQEGWNDEEHDYIPLPQECISLA